MKEDHENKNISNKINQEDSELINQRKSDNDHSGEKEKKSILFSEAWKELKSSPNSLYFIFLLKFLESYSYFCIIYTLIIFLSEEYKYTDEQAGWSYGLFGMCTSVYGFIFGGYLIDNLGVRLSLCLGSCLLFIGRCLLVICTKHLHIILILYTVLPIGTCLGIPVMQIAIRRFTTDKSISLAYSIFYAMMNVSAIFSASAIDFFRRNVVDQTINLHFFSFELSAYRALFLSGACTTIFSMFISFFLIKETKVEDNKKNTNSESSLSRTNCENLDSKNCDEENASLIRKSKDNLNNTNNSNCGYRKEIYECEKAYKKNYVHTRDDSTFDKNSKVLSNENEDSSLCLINSKDNNTNRETSLFSDKNQCFLNGNENIADLKNQNSKSESNNLNNINRNINNINNHYSNPNNIGFNSVNYINIKSKEIECKQGCIVQDNILPIKKIAGPCEILGEVTSQKSFWKFVSMIILLMGVRIVYRHLDATFPKYMIREFGKDVMYGSIIAINPFLIVILIPIFAPLSYQFSAYSQITFGALITSLSPFFLTIDTQMWSAIMFVVILSIGEALWSPRLYEYTIFITEEGREGIYMALASSPMFIATLITGATSGTFLEAFCPEKGIKQSWKMWMWIGLITLTSPILLSLFKSKIEVTDEELKNEKIEKQRKKKEEEEKQILIYEQANNKLNNQLMIDYANYFNKQTKDHLNRSLPNNININNMANYKKRVSFTNFTNLMIEDSSFTIGNSIVRENEFTLGKKE